MTINNDLPATEVTIGSDTALNSIVADVGKINQSAVATRHCFVVEVMATTRATSHHPGAQVVCRDGSAAYAEAIRQGAPKAVQVSDRWQCAMRRLVVFPAQSGGTRREVLGSDGLPGAER
jgi:hypothetical protein